MRSFFVATLASVMIVFASPPVLAQGRDLPDFADLVERVGPAVVNIRTTERLRGVPSVEGLDDDDVQELFRRFFGVPAPQTPGPDKAPTPRGRRGDRGDRGTPDAPRERGVASGFILSADGYVMTNAHVVESASEIIVTLTDKREFKGKLIGADKRTDVALVKIEASGLPKNTIGDSRGIRVGQWVLAIGSPFGLANTVTAGIVSAKGRDTGELLPFIQTDAAINPGNSGGPLINMRGEVIGINSQILSGSGGSIGISFAIPVDDAMRIVEQLKNGGRVRRGRLGVEIQELGKDVADAMGIKPQGAVVSRVEVGTPAEKAGVMPGDVILKFDGKTIEKSVDLPRAVGDTKPGTKSMLSVLRKGTPRDIPIVVSELDSDTKRPPKAPEPPKPAVTNNLGLSVVDLGEEKRKQLNIASGVLVESVEGSAASTGLRRDDIVLALNNVDVTSAKQFNEQVVKLDAKKQAFLLVRRGENVFYLPLRPTQRQ
ncbi:MAG: Do family serine endopeptidase [Burkholderiaceae bacterium]